MKNRTIFMVTPKAKLQRRINFMTKLGYDIGVLLVNGNSLLIKWTWRV